MYHRFVAAKVRKTIDQINTGDWESTIAVLAPQFTYRFYGDSALSGERHTPAAMRLWGQRIRRLLPDVRFDLQEIIVSGWPWYTRFATSIRVSAALPDGSRYENIINQFTHLRWGRVTEIRTLEDTATLEHALDVLAASGVAEAHAAPITDESAAVATTA